MTEQSKDIGDTLVSAPPLATECVLEQQGAFVEPAEAERAEVDIPLGIIHLDEADVLAAEGLTDIHPVAVPADAAVVADAADLVVARVLERGEAARVRPRGRRVDARRRLLVERLVRPLLVDTVRKRSNRCC